MADEPTLLALVRERPDDAAARLVYADWLEQQGDRKRADIVRAAQELAGAALDTDGALDRAHELLTLARRAAPEWLAAIAHPSLTGTCWGTQSYSRTPALLGFRANGVLVFKRLAETWPGTWSQVGNAVTFTINKYSPHEGLVVGDRMGGTATNKSDQIWTWGGIRLPNDALDADPFPDLQDAPRDSQYEQRPKRNRR
jgi:uncharacterized protein (TIGR02996 family)